MGNVNLSESADPLSAEYEGLGESPSPQSEGKHLVDQSESGSANVKDDVPGVDTGHVLERISIPKDSRCLDNSSPNMSLPLSDSVIPETCGSSDSPAPQNNLAPRDHTVKTNNQKDTHLGCDTIETKTPSDNASASPPERISATPTSINIPVVTYADATNVATLYPELAATVLSMPLSHASSVAAPSVSNTSTVQDDADWPRSSMHEHTEDRPNWALAPDPHPNLESETKAPLPRSKARGKSSRKSKVVTHPQRGAMSSRTERSSKGRNGRRAANYKQDLSPDKSTPTRIASLPPFVESDPPRIQHASTTRTGVPVAMAAGANSVAPCAQIAIPNHFGPFEGGEIRREGFASNNLQIAHFSSSQVERNTVLEQFRDGSTESLAGSSSDSCASSFGSLQRDVLRSSFDIPSQEAHGEWRSPMLYIYSGPGNPSSFSASSDPSLGVSNGRSRQSGNRLDVNLKFPSQENSVGNPSHPGHGSRADEGHAGPDYSHPGEEQRYRADVQTSLVYQRPSPSTCYKLAESALGHDSSWSIAHSEDDAEQRHLSQSDRNLHRQEWLERSGQNGRSGDGSRDPGGGSRHGGWQHRRGDRSDPGCLSISSGAGHLSSYDERSCDGSNGSTYGIGCDAQKHCDPRSYDHAHHGSFANTETIPDSVTDFWQHIHDAWAISASEDRSNKATDHCQPTSFPRSSNSNGQLQNKEYCDYGTFDNDGLILPSRSMTNESNDQTSYSYGLAPDPQEHWVPLSSYTEAIRGYDKLQARGSSQPVLLQQMSVAIAQGNKNEQDTLYDRSDFQMVPDRSAANTSNIESLGPCTSAANIDRSDIPAQALLLLNVDRNAEAGFHGNPPPPQLLAGTNNNIASRPRSCEFERGGTYQESLASAAPIRRPSLDARAQSEGEMYSQRPTSHSAGLIYATNGYPVPFPPSEQRCPPQPEGRLALDACGPITRVLTPSVRVGVEAMVSDAVKIPTPEFEASRNPAELRPHPRGRSIVRTGPEEVSSWRAKRVVSTDRKLGWRAQHPSPKYALPSAHSGSASTATNQNDTEMKKYDFIPSNTPPSCAKVQGASPLRDVRQRINTPPLPSVNRFDSLGERLTSITLDASPLDDSVFTSPKALEYRERGKENITNTMDVEDTPLFP